MSNNMFIGGIQLLHVNTCCLLNRAGNVPGHHHMATIKKCEGPVL